MQPIKSNEKINIVKCKRRSYVLIKDDWREIGLLRWHHRKRKWIFEDKQ